MDYALTFITGNPAKAAQLSRHLAFPIQHKKLDLPEVQSLDLDEVVRYKAKEAYSVLRQPVLVEDTGLSFNAMGQLPGPLIKWFLKELGNAGLCTLLDNYSDRSAIAKVVCGIYDGKTMNLFSGEANGSISSIPKGDEGFGWDPVFIPHGATKTWGEMTPDEQNETSMRRIALKKLEIFLNNLNT